MATVLRKKLSGGSISYKIQSKAKDPLTGLYKYMSKTWRKPPTMTEYQAKRELEKLKCELDEKIRTEVQGITAKTSPLKFDEYADNWLEKQKLERGPMYYLRHKANLEIIKSYFKRIRLVDINPNLTSDFREMLLKHKSVHESAIMKPGKDLRLIAKSKRIVIKKIKSFIDVGFGTYEAANRGTPILYTNAVKICSGLGVKFEDYFDKIVTTKPYSKITIGHIMETLNLILKDAKRKRIINDNFASSEYLVPLKGERKEIVVLDDEEARRLKKQLDLEPNIRWKTALYLVLMTGMRRSELCGLEWKDIDFQHETISIVRSCHEVPKMGLVTKDTKTFTSRRTITMPKVLVQVLKDYQKWYENRRSILGDEWAKTDRLMISDEGTIIYPSIYRVWLKKVLEKANLKKVTLHSLRHTNITMQLTAGVDLKTVSSRAGHSRTSTTTDIYSHFMKNSDRHASKIIDEIFSSEEMKQKNEDEE